MSEFQNDTWHGESPSDSKDAEVWASMGLPSDQQKNFMDFLNDLCSLCDIPPNSLGEDEFYDLRYLVEYWCKHKSAPPTGWLEARRNEHGEP